MTVKSMEIQAEWVRAMEGQRQDSEGEMDGDREVKT